MSYRLTQLEVPLENPYQFDVLDRQPLVEFLTGLVERAGGPFVLALDSPWGTGKTTLVRMFAAELNRQNYSYIYFNAWQVDYVTDPLVALVSSLDTIDLGVKGRETSFKEHIKSAKRVTSLIAKRTVVAAAKAVTVGALNLDEEIEAVASELSGDTVGDIVEAFQKEASLLERFKGELGSAVEELGKAGKKPTLVFFVDEIDRCRPTFAIDLLERIKHLFDVSNIIFILSLDKKQLESGISVVYGQNIDADEYLRRFIDLEYSLPLVNSRAFVESLFSRFGMNEVFSRRSHPDLRYDRNNFVDFFAALSDTVPLTLRAQERCMTRLRVVMDQTPDDHYLEPILVSLLIVIRISNNELFCELKMGNAYSEQVVNYLLTLPGAKFIAKDRMVSIIEASLIHADDNDSRRKSIKNALRAEVQSQQNSATSRQKETLEMLEHLNSRMGRGVKLSKIIAKIDLAAGIK